MWARLTCEVLSVTKHASAGSGAGVPRAPECGEGSHAGSRPAGNSQTAPPRPDTRALGELWPRGLRADVGGARHRRVAGRGPSPSTTGKTATPSAFSQVLLSVPRPPEQASHWKGPVGTTGWNC